MGGPLYALLGSGVTVTRSDVTVGEMRSAGSVPLCKKDAEAAVILASIEPLNVRGDVRLDGVAVRTTRWGEPDGPSDIDTHMVGRSPGVPAGLRPPRGYEVPTSCDSPSDPVGGSWSRSPRRGARGGTLDGLLLRYVAEGQLHEFELRSGVSLCGTATMPGCRRS
jgi:hypothetical protein